MARHHHVLRRCPESRARDRASKAKCTGQGQQVDARCSFGIKWWTNVSSKMRQKRRAVFCHATNRIVPLSAASHDDAVLANMVLPLDTSVNGPSKESESSTFTSKVSTRSRRAARNEDFLEQIWEYIDFEPDAKCHIHSKAFGAVSLGPSSLGINSDLAWSSLSLGKI